MCKCSPISTHPWIYPMIIGSYIKLHPLSRLMTISLKSKCVINQQSPLSHLRGLLTSNGSTQRLHRLLLHHGSDHMKVMLLNRGAKAL